jgi:hypothetical protein
MQHGLWQKTLHRTLSLDLRLLFPLLDDVWALSPGGILGPHVRLRLWHHPVWPRVQVSLKKAFWCFLFFNNIFAANAFIS